MTSVDYNKIFSIKEATQEFFFEASEIFKIIGNNSSAVTGIMLIFGTVKFVLDWIINGIALYNLFGYSWRLFFGFCSTLTTMFLNGVNTMNQIVTDAIESRVQAAQNNDINKKEKLNMSK